MGHHEAHFAFKPPTCALDLRTWQSMASQEWMAEVKKHLGLGSKEINEIADVFFKEARVQIPELEEINSKAAINAEDIERVIWLAHTMKSAGLFLKFDDVVTSTADIESNARAAGQNRCKLDDFGAQLASLKQNVTAWSVVTG